MDASRVGLHPLDKLRSSPRKRGPSFCCQPRHRAKWPVVSFFVYILASKRNGTLYVGMTDDLSRRVWEHRTGVFPGFTSKYGVKTLVWFEVQETRESAFTRERQIKKWKRRWKLQLIEEMNPTWKDLVEEGWLW